MKRPLITGDWIDMLLNKAVYSDGFLFFSNARNSSSGFETARDLTFYIFNWVICVCLEAERDVIKRIPVS